MKNPWLEQSNKRAETIAQAIARRFREIGRQKVEEFITSPYLSRAIQDEILNFSCEDEMAENQAYLAELEEEIRRFQQRKTATP